MLSFQLCDWETDLITLWRRWSDETTISPFQTLQYQEIFWQHFPAGERKILIVMNDDEIVALAGVQKGGQKIIFLGMAKVVDKEEVSDYGDFIYAPNFKKRMPENMVEILVTWAKQNSLQLIQFDYVRETSPLYELVKNTNQKIIFQKQEISPLLTLPTEWSEYVQALPKKKRDELKRKLRRLDAVEPMAHFNLQPSTNLMTEFIKLHHLSDGSKQHFMSPQMAAFFTDLAFATYEGGWQWRFASLELKSKNVAMVAYFSRENDSILLYNSGYNPEYQALGLGFGLKAKLIQFAIENKYSQVDFLRGAERYKFDMGAIAQQLWQISLPIL